MQVFAQEFFSSGNYSGLLVRAGSILPQDFLRSEGQA
jgi:hypothetical protein